MKKLLLFLPLVLGIILCYPAPAQQFGTLYIAAKSGLNMRDNPDPGSAVLATIPYGTKVTLIQQNEEYKKIITEGMTGYWQKVKYNNKTGYIVDAYLLPWAPPSQATIKKSEYNQLRNYLAQISPIYGTRLVVKSGKTDSMDDMAWELSKQLYKNGAEWHKLSAFESGTDTYFLPGFSLQQGFQLLRLIPEFKEVFGENDVFPAESKKFKKDDVEYEIAIHNKTYGEGEYQYSWLQRISVSFSPGASYEFEMYMLDNQLVISLGGGV